MIKVTIKGRTYELPDVATAVEFEMGMVSGLETVQEVIEQKYKKPNEPKPKKRSYDEDLPKVKELVDNGKKLTLAFKEIFNRYPVQADKIAWEKFKAVSDFPIIFPVNLNNCKDSFISMLRRVVDNKTELSYKEINIFPLQHSKDGNERSWNGQHWHTFTTQFMLNATKIARYLGVENKFRQIKDSNDHDVLRYD